VDKREAMLRELNLSPVWRERVAVAAKIADPAEIPEAAANVAEAAPLVEYVAPPEISEPIAVPAAVQAVVAIPATTDVVASPLDSMDWAALKTTVRDCTACPLRSGCTQTVFGVGDEQADWLFVGEGPGADEDARGEPFVGQAGKLLDNMLLAMQLKRGQRVYIANIVKCRPPGNRAPEAAEIARCLPYLQRQIELIQPKIIVALGKTAANALLGRDATLGSLRGTTHDYHGIPLVITYHPAYLLRSPLEKAKAWQDLQDAMRIMSAPEDKKL
jgi:DNA polymerase